MWRTRAHLCEGLSEIPDENSRIRVRRWIGGESWDHAGRTWHMDGYPGGLPWGHNIPWMESIGENKRALCLTRKRSMRQKKIDSTFDTQINASPHAFGSALFDLPCQERLCCQPQQSAPKESTTQISAAYRTTTRAWLHSLSGYLQDWSVLISIVSIPRRCRYWWLRAPAISRLE